MLVKLVKLSLMQTTQSMRTGLLMGIVLLVKGLEIDNR